MTLGPTSLSAPAVPNHVDIDVIGTQLLHVVALTIPTAPINNGQGNYGFYDLGGTTDLLIEDCQFSYFVNDITFQGYYSGLTNVSIRRNEILDAYSTNGHAEGMYAESVTNLTIQDNIFDHDGWNASVSGASPTIYNHDCYLHSSNNNCDITGNTFADAASFGLQARGGGIVDDNFFVNDPYGFSFGLVNGATTHAGGVTGEAIGNVVIEPRPDASGWGIGAYFGNLKPGGGTKISNNIFADDAPNANNPAMMFQPGNGVANPQQEVGLNTVVISNNTVYNWAFGVGLSSQYVPGSTGADGFTGVSFVNNNFQQNVNPRIISHGNLFDPRYESWSGDTYWSPSASQSSWFTLQGTTTSFASWKANIEPTAVATKLLFQSPGRTIESYMSSQGLTGTESAFAAGIQAMSESNWNPLYYAPTIDSYVEAGYIFNSSIPTATVVPPADVTSQNYQSNPTPPFTITYTDDFSINASTIPGAAVTVTGPNGTTLPVTFEGVTGKGNSYTATYQGTRHERDWTSIPVGTYVISLANNSVADNSGNFVPGGALGSFHVSVSIVSTGPTTPATTPIKLQ